MKTHTVNHKFVSFTLATILMVLGVQKPSYSQDLDVGEPRTVRMIYFLPNDRQYDPNVVQKMKDEIRTIQNFYAEQMQAHGYSNKTFRVETDAQGEPTVHRVDGQHPEIYYGFDLVLYEIEQLFALQTNIYLVVLDNSQNNVDGAGGRALNGGKNSGYLIIPKNFDWITAAHELGHTFGLEHDFRDGNYIMSYGPGQNRLSACSAKYLAVHPHFNPDVDEANQHPPMVEIISPRIYPTGLNRIPIRLKVTDIDGIHQVLLFVKTQPPHFSVGFPELKACRELTGETEAVVEFDYDGIVPSDGSTNLSNPDVHLIYVRTVDRDGNIGKSDFSLIKNSIYRDIIPVEERSAAIYGLTFSHDNAILAAALGDTLDIKLWDATTQADRGTLVGHSDKVVAVAFSPNELILASGAWDGTVMLWDVATRTPIKTLRHTSSNWGRINSVAFSPDGTMLASVSGDDWSDPPEHTVKLWDVATRTPIETLEGHTHAVQTVAFSPDGTTLASGGFDGYIILWDIATRTRIKTIVGDVPLTTVAFSPDGEILAAGGLGPTVSLWDIATETRITDFWGHTNIVRSVEFSPGGEILASADQDGKILLWDMETQTEITALEAHTQWIFSAVFSPDGRTLASGAGQPFDLGGDYTIILWDTSRWIKSQLSTLPDLEITEIMVASNDSRLPQWIELYNCSETQAVNLKGWTLEIQNRPSPNFNGHVNTVLSFKEKVIAPQETLLIISKQGRASNHFGEEQIYNLNTLHPNLQDTVLSEEGFYLKLRNKAGELVDAVGNLDGRRNTNDKPAWPLPIGVTEDGTRTAMIRRYDRATARLGTEASGWISAVNTNLATNTTTYYGHPTDIGAPGIESGGALPVSLSYFRAELTDVGVVLRWITESELDNAGFNILRSETKNGTFKIVNSALIQGAGTTSERQTYTWKDTTAKPNVVYYYRIEDISHAGIRKQLATIRLRGYVSATGKLTTKWGDLKLQE